MFNLTDKCCSDDFESNGTGCCRSKGSFVIVAAFMLALALFGGAYVLSNAKGQTISVSENPAQKVITVSGSASKMVAPDIMMLQLRVQTDAQDARKAQQDNAVVSNQLLARLRALGIKESDIQTTQYSVDPIYDNQPTCKPAASAIEDCIWKNVITGYRTTHNFIVKTENLDKGGEIIDGVSSISANQTFVDSISFGLKDATIASLKAKLLTNASIEAKVHAQKIADGLGVRLGQVFSASEGYTSTPTPYYRDNYLTAAAEGSAPATKIAPGQLEISASMSLSYEIAQ